jgi:hypothetical protein
MLAIFVKLELDVWCFSERLEAVFGPIEVWHLLGSFFLDFTVLGDYLLFWVLAFPVEVCLLFFFRVVVLALVIEIFARGTLP